MSEIKKERAAPKKRIARRKIAAIPKGMIKLTNHMKCPWIVPAEIVLGQTKSDVPKLIDRHNYFRQQQKLIMPNQSITVDKGAYSKYYNACRAFQAMIDYGHVVPFEEVIPEPMLKSVKPATPPADLCPTPEVAMHVEGQGTKSMMDKIQHTAALNK